MDENRKKILWVDDYIYAFSDYSEGLSRKGFDIEVAIDFEAVDQSKIERCDILIIDNKIGDEGLNDGYNFIDNLTGTRTKPLKVIFFSAYLSEQDQLFKISPDRDREVDIFYYPKKFVKSSQRESAVENFVESVEKFSTLPLDSGGVEDFICSIRSDPQAVNSFVDFSRLDNEQQSEVIESFSAKFEQDADALFAKGATWILFLSDESMEHSSSLSGGSRPDWKKINSISEKANQIPVLFEINLPVDDLRCESENAIGDIESYPRATVFLDRDHSQTGVEIHFDTGSDKTFLSSRLVAEIGLAEETDETTKIVKISGNKLFCTAIRWPIAVSPDPAKSGNNKLRGTLFAYSVSNWETCPLQVTCSTNCVRAGGVAGYKCNFRRNGLLGRNLVRDMEVDALIQYDSPDVKFSRTGIFRKRGGRGK